MIGRMENGGGIIEAEAKTKPGTCPWESWETCRICKQDYPGIKCPNIPKSNQQACRVCGLDQDAFRKMFGIAPNEPTGCELHTK